MNYDNEEKISILQCLANMLNRGLFNNKKACKPCQDKYICYKIVQTFEEEE